jgi:cytoskeletal protein CcmA (bactofilin family)
MFNKRKNQAKRQGQANWQEPKVDPAAAPGAAGAEAPAGPSAGQPQNARAGASQGGQPPSHGQQGYAQQGHPQPGAAKQAPSRPDASAVLNRQPSPPVRPDSSRRAQSAAANASTQSAQPAASQARASEPADHKRLLVGKEISLSGEIRSCDTLVVEGTVEAELNGTQILDIQQSGLFKGSATVDTAEIAGRFEGKLTVRERLHVHATGHIHGEIKYKNLEIDSGGRIGGTLMELSPEEAETAHHTAGVGNGAAGSPAGGAAPGGAASGDATSSGPSGDGAGTATGNAGSYANGAGAPAGGGF